MCVCLSVTFVSLHSFKKSLFHHKNAKCMHVWNVGDLACLIINVRFGVAHSRQRISQTRLCQITFAWAYEPGLIATIRNVIISIILLFFNLISMCLFILEQFWIFRRHCFARTHTRTHIRADSRTFLICMCFYIPFSPPLLRSLYSDHNVLDVICY